MRTLHLAAFLTFFGSLGLAPEALALPAPARPMPPLEPALPPLSLKVDLRNLTGPDEAGRLEESELISKLDAANRVWSQCAIQFSPRSFANVSTQALGVPYAPQSQDDLSRIASALNPDGFTAIPLTVAGKWEFHDNGSGLFLTGLGWVFTNSSGIDRIGAMISNTKLSDPSAGPIIAHELAHALSLPHTAEERNLMGKAGTNELTREQCNQARGFAQNSLRSLLL